jgi:hypothetical protein
MTTRVQHTFPIGRLISGDVYKGQDKDYQGNPKLDKQGQPTISFYMGVAIAKTPNVPWEQESWGQVIMDVARKGVPGSFDPQTGQLFPGRPFATKVTDGDSQVPNQNNKKPCDMEGAPGHWILNFNNGFAPKVCDKTGTKFIAEEGVVKRGDYVQVVGSIAPNTDNRNPGVFLNHEVVAHSGYGEEIYSGVDIASAGLGQGPAPAGMSTTPVGGMTQQTTQTAPPQQVAPPNTQGTAPPPPATDLVQTQAAPNPHLGGTQAAPPPPAEPSYNIQGQVYTRSQLLASPGYTEEIINNLTPIA